MSNICSNVPLKEICLEQVVCKQKKFHICLMFDSYLILMFEICLIFVWFSFDWDIRFFQMFPWRRSVLSRWFVSRRSFIFVTQVVQGFASYLSAKRNWGKISLISQMQLHTQRQIQISKQIQNNQYAILVITLTIFAITDEHVKIAEPLNKNITELIKQL